MPKEVKISYKLFQELCKYHLGDQDWSDIHYIKRELSDKLQRMVDREQYKIHLVYRQKRRRYVGATPYKQRINSILAILAY